MKGFLFLAAAFALGSCASTDSFTLPDGRTGYVIKCDGNWSSMAACYNAASEKCGGGKYEILNRTEATGVVSNGEIIAPKPLRSLEFVCSV